MNWTMSGLNEVLCWTMQRARKLRSGRVGIQIVAGCMYLVNVQRCRIRAIVQRSMLTLTLSAYLPSTRLSVRERLSLFTNLKVVMFNSTRQQIDWISLATSPDPGVHDASALKANDRRETQDFYSFRTLSNEVQRPGDPPANNKGLPLKDIDKAIGSLHGSAGIRNSSTTVDADGPSRRVRKHIPGQFLDNQILLEVEREASAAGKEPDLSQPTICRRRRSAAFPLFPHKLADTKDRSATANLSSIDLSTSALGVPMEDVIPPSTAHNIFPIEEDPARKAGNRLHSIPESRAGSIRFSSALDEIIARQMSERGHLMLTQSQSLSLTANTRAQEHISECPDSAQDLPSPPDFSPTLSDSCTDSHLDCKLGLQNLWYLYDRQHAELKESQEMIERLETEILREKADLSRSVQDAIIQRQENNTNISTLEEQIFMITTELNNLKKEKQGWQEQLDAMQHCVQHAERQVRCLDNLMRLKMEAREDGAFGSVRRANKFEASNQKPSTDVINLVVSLNQVILQYAHLLTENMRPKFTLPGKIPAHVKRSKDVLGSKVTTLLQKHASPFYNFRPFLMLVILELFMVHWCTQIIEGWYPKHKSFADVLLELSQATKSSTNVPCARIDHGKIKILQTDVSTDSDYSRWASDIHQDLSEILSVGSVWLDSGRFKSKLFTLVKRAYEVRTALAEKDLCGGLETLIVGHGMPFQHKWMNEEHSTERSASAPSMKMDLVAGTCGIGLRRLAGGKTSVISTPANANEIANVVLKPKVVLEKVLDEYA
ncbi:hypothetical protein D9613_002541 [Agrocybe pediades]|uniref:Uncharacterized protein n=1 Tax=Agrocybe pediades TaxID=84607 RepID=A0A8H4VLX7_9AGAR|nr:hypothetical protein D9613_002541 [Agrocybe pediades]